MSYYQIKDHCRKGLLSYLGKTISNIPKAGNYRILDIGCGTGVPSLFLADHFNGSITAIDTCEPALIFLQDKINANNLQSINSNISKRI